MENQIVEEAIISILDFNIVQCMPWSTNSRIHNTFALQIALSLSIN